MEIKKLNNELIERANSCSFNGNRGKLREESYNSYVKEILEWKISDEKKQKILDKLYEKHSKILNYEAQFVSVMVAGPAKYNAKKWDKSDKILELTKELCDWYADLKEQLETGAANDQSNKAKELIKGINRLYKLNLNPTNDIMKLAFVDNKAFIAIYEKYNEIYKWRKNSNIYKLYRKSLNGEVAEIKKETFFEDKNLTAYTEGDRAYIQFVMRPQRQLIVALKSRKWWWNSYKKAWSTYLEKLDKEWVENISVRYGNYI